MPRKSSAARAEREPASLPEVPIPLSEVPEHQRAAYQIALIDDPPALKAALSTDEFFPMIGGFPEAWWERLSLYLYRRPDDEGRMVKNDGPRKYISVLRQPIDEEYVTRKWGGGKYTLYLKLDSKETLREHTFVIDGAPKVLPGQFVEIDGKPVPVGSAAPNPVPEPQTDIAKVIEASADANAKSQEMLTTAAKASIELVKENAINSAPKENTLDTAIKLIALLKPEQPQGNSMKDTLEIIDHLDAIAARRNPAPVEHEEKATPIQETLDAVKELTGGVTLAELLKPVSRAAAADPVAGWAPIVSTIGSVVSQFFEKLPTIQAQRIQTLDREIYLRQLAAAERTGQPAPTPPAHAALPPAPAPAPTPAPQPTVVNQTPDPAQLMNMLVQHICRGFDKAPIGEWGEQTAASMDFHFSNAIESLGISATLANPDEVDKFVAGVPELEKRSHDARWKKFRFEFMEYCIPRWGNLTDEQEEELIQRMAGLDNVPPKPGPQPVA